MTDKYDCNYSAFDMDLHKKTYPCYLEVLIDADGNVMYATPSHQEKAIELACHQLGKTRQEIVNMCPPEKYFDYRNWLLGLTGAVAVWYDGLVFHSINRKQINKLKRFKMAGIYKGYIPAPTVS